MTLIPKRNYKKPYLGLFRLCWRVKMVMPNLDFKCVGIVQMLFLPHRLYFCTPHSPEMRVGSRLLHHMLYFLKVCWDNGTYKNWLSSFCNLLEISCTPCTDFNLRKAQHFFATLFPVAWLSREAFPRLVTVGVKSKEAIILWGWKGVRKRDRMCTCVTHFVGTCACLRSNIVDLTSTSPNKINRSVLVL